jgi:hypothetical protein
MNTLTLSFCQLIKLNEWYIDDSFDDLTSCDSYLLTNNLLYIPKKDLFSLNVNKEYLITLNDEFIDIYKSNPHLGKLLLIAGINNRNFNVKEI